MNSIKYRMSVHVMLLVTGSLLILIGAYSIAQPWHSFSYFVKYTGLTLIVSSVLLLVYSFLPGINVRESKWIVAESLVDFSFASVLIFNPFLTVIAFPLIIGSWLFIRGGLKVLLSLFLSRQIGGWKNILTVGIISMLFGLIFILYPYGRPLGAGLRISVFAILIGALYIYDALRLKRSDDTLIGLV